MGATKAEKQELKGIGYELFIGALSILSIVNLVLQLVVQDPSLETVLAVINACLLYTSPSPRD